MSQTTSTLLITALVFLIISVLGLIGLNVSQKSNRQYERKGVVWYLAINLLVFLILGLIGLLVKNEYLIVIRITQLIALVFGLFHSWFLFTNYEWSNHTSFLPETILTLIITATAGLGYILGLWLWASLFELGNMMELLVSAIYPLVLLIPLPYLLLRTYDYMLQIPEKKYVAWSFPKEAAPRINLSDKNVIFVYLTLYTQSKKYPAGKITNHRARLPKDASFVAFFQNFVKDYNQTSTDYPIIHLQQNENEQDVGWIFRGSRTEKGRKQLIDPFLSGFRQLQEGDYIFAKRVLLGKAYTAPQQPMGGPPDDFRFNNDDAIIITEK